MSDSKSRILKLINERLNDSDNDQRTTADVANWLIENYPEEVRDVFQEHVYELLRNLVTRELNTQRRESMRLRVLTQAKPIEIKSPLDDAWYPIASNQERKPIGDMLKKDLLFQMNEWKSRTEIARGEYKFFQYLHDNLPLGKQVREIWTDEEVIELKARFTEGKQGTTYLGKEKNE